MAIVAAVAAFFWFVKSWQRLMAEKLCEEFGKQGLRQKIGENIERYWNDTTQAFKKGADALEQDWLAYLADLKKIVDADSREAIQSRIDALERLNDFFSHLPWVPFRRTLNRPKGENTAGDYNFSDVMKEEASVS